MSGHPSPCGCPSACKPWSDLKLARETAERAVQTYLRAEARWRTARTDPEATESALRTAWAAYNAADDNYDLAHAARLEAQSLFSQHVIDKVRTAA